MSTEKRKLFSKEIYEIYEVGYPEELKKFFKKKEIEPTISDYLHLFIVNIRKGESDDLLMALECIYNMKNSMVAFSSLKILSLAEIAIRERTLLFKKFTLGSELPTEKEAREIIEENFEGCVNTSMFLAKFYDAKLQEFIFTLIKKTFIKKGLLEQYLNFLSNEEKMVQEDDWNKLLENAVKHETIDFEMPKITGLTSPKELINDFYQKIKDLSGR